MVASAAVVVVMVEDFVWIGRVIWLEGAEAALAVGDG